MLTGLRVRERQKEVSVYHQFEKSKRKQQFMCNMHKGYMLSLPQLGKEGLIAII